MNSIISNSSIMAQWDYEKNDVTPESVSVSERKPKRYWRCAKCGYVWMSSVESRMQSKGKCPCCESGKAIMPGYNDVLTLVPEILEIFQQDLNPNIDLSTLGIGSKKRILWVCRECGRIWETELHSRIRYTDGKYSVLKCPHYNTVKRDPAEVLSISAHPEIMRFWNPENTIDPNSIPANSNSKVLLLCPDCGYNWTSSPASFLRNSQKCPACELHKAVQPGINDIFTLAPELERYYDYSQNVGVDPTLLGVGSRKQIHWKCPDCGREWTAPVNTRLVNENGTYRAKQCRTCYLKNPSRFKPVSAFPDLVQFWDFENNTVDIRLTPSHSRQEVIWRCKMCGYQWSSSPRDRLRSAGNCPCCESGKKVMPGFNDALTRHPGLLKIYEPQLNQGKDLSGTASYSEDQFTWKCETCGYTWVASVRNTVNSAYHCPNCLKRRAIPGVNSLADKRPDLAALWSAKNSKSPEEVLCNSYYWASWLCETCNGEYNAYVVDLVNGTAQCPYCSDKRFLPGVNSFQAKHPDLMKEWNYVNNYTICSPNSISDSCDISVWWICANNHSYTMTPRDRLVYQQREKESCPYCKGRRRKKRHFL